jgi:hypothetical protein
VRVRLIFALTLSIAVLVLLGGATASQAAPGSLRILITTNNAYSSEFGAALAAKPGVAGVDTFDTSAGTPSPESLATYDVVAGLGDSSYQDPSLWGNRLADFIDAGGVFTQFAYDNWDSTGAHPTGRFESGGYQAFIPGPDDALFTSLGTILVPDSPLLSGVSDFTTDDNTTPTVAAGATLLAKWEDDRNAIATKGRVLSVAASPQNGSLDPMSAAAQLAVNAGNVLGRHRLAVTKAGKGKGKVTSTPAGIACGTVCTALVPFGTEVTLTAKPTSKSAFKGWGGACSGKKACRTVIGTADQGVTARFAKRCKKGRVLKKVRGKRKCVKKKAKQR